MGNTPQIPVSAAGQQQDKDREHNEPLFEHGRMVTFAKRHVQPPADIYFTPDDNLMITCWNIVAGAQVQVGGRILQPDGRVTPFEEIYAPTSDSQPNYFVMAMTEGFLLDLVIAPYNTQFIRGQCYVQGSLVRGGTAKTFVCGIFLQGYATDMRWPSWPPGLSEDSLDGQGAMVTYQPANPAAGSDVIFTMPYTIALKLHTLQFTLVTDATVANRELNVQFLDPSGIIVAHAFNSPTQAASSTGYYESVVGLPALTASGGGGLNGIWMPDPVLMPGGIIRTKILNLDPGDQISNVVLYAEQWFA